MPTFDQHSTPLESAKCFKTTAWKSQNGREMTADKRRYQRRSPEERIADLQSRIEGLRAKVEAKQRKDLPVIAEIPKVKRRLLKFSQLALDNGREDISNSTRMFLAGLERAADREP